jgi:uncharacterized protein (TIGR00255 family)
MIRSMTGFGIARSEVDGIPVEVEVRSVNNRHFKCTLRVPEELSALEADMEAACTRRLTRGSVLVTLRVVASAARRGARIDGDVLYSYIAQLTKMLGSDEAQKVDRGQLLMLPGVVVEDGSEVFLEHLRPIVLGLVDEACQRVIESRVCEGETIRAHLSECASTLRTRAKSIQLRAPQLVDAYQARLRQRMDVMLKEVGKSVEPSDLLREVAIFAERSDIAEEVVRLGGHIDQLERLLDRSNNAPVGRPLDFLAQELLREANTIASKSADVETAQQVVEIKTAIDRIKEQAQNVE